MVWVDATSGTDKSELMEGSSESWFSELKERELRMMSGGLVSVGTFNNPSSGTEFIFSLRLWDYGDCLLQRGSFEVVVVVVVVVVDWRAL